MIKTVKLPGGAEYSIGKIVCVGRNYAEHAKELGNEVPENPILFLKPPSALTFDNGEIIYPAFSQKMHHEVELVLLIGKDIVSATHVEAKNAIAGYAVGLDMTLRDVQDEARSQGKPWTVAKGFDTSAAVSTFIAASHVDDISTKEIALEINGAVKQRERLSQMIFSPEHLVSFISSRMKLEEGDLIYTGTPKGVGLVQRGDVISARIQDVGELKVKVV